MNSEIKQQSALETAKSLMFEPWGLTENTMSAALGEIFTHRADYADLYFQYSRFESWGLEEGVVKAGNFSIQQGVGVRAISGEKTAFAYSDNLSSDAVISSARVVKSIATQGGSKIASNRSIVPVNNSLYPAVDPVNSLSAPEKVALLERIESMAKAADPRIIQVM